MQRFVFTAHLPVFRHHFPCFRVSEQTTTDFWLGLSHRAPTSFRPSPGAFSSLRRALAVALHNFPRFLIFSVASSPNRYVTDFHNSDCAVIVIARSCTPFVQTLANLEINFSENAQRKEWRYQCQPVECSAAQAVVQQAFSSWPVTARAAGWPQKGTAPDEAEQEELVVCSIDPTAQRSTTPHYTRPFEELLVCLDSSYTFLKIYPLRVSFLFFKLHLQ